MESILLTIRTMIGIEDDYDGFDIEIMSGINSAIFSLRQLGIGPPDFAVTSINETWTDLYAGVNGLESIKSYILLKTKLEFDPPATSFIINSMNEVIKQLEFRLMVEVDPDPVAE